MSTPASPIQCRFHAEQAAIGVCMRCRAPICRECCTRVRGVNHCHACLRKLAQPAEVSGAGSGARGFAAASMIAAAWLGLALVLYWIQGYLAP